jgi:FkbM family methyltransferase
LPEVSYYDTVSLAGGIFKDTFSVYMDYGDKYDEETINHLFDDGEGPYGLRNTLVDVTVEPEDIVIDAGSWIGDFAAYASVKGATVYAFEPTSQTYEMLLKTAGLNANIYPVKKGLGDAERAASIILRQENSGGNTVMSGEPSAGANDIPADSIESISITTIDHFVEENNLPRVDFIKADIEGFERHMIA